VRFEPSDWVWVHMRKERFPEQRRSKSFNVISSFKSQQTWIRLILGSQIPLNSARICIRKRTRHRFNPASITQTEEEEANTPHVSHLVKNKKGHIEILKCKLRRRDYY
jgi:hypothetical protein